MFRQYLTGLRDDGLRNHLYARFNKKKHLQEKPNAERIRERSNEFYRFGKPLEQAMHIGANGYTPATPVAPNMSSPHLPAPFGGYRPIPPNTGMARGTTVCYNCQGIGHLSRDCPRRQNKAINVIEDIEQDGNPELTSSVDPNAEFSVDFGQQGETEVFNLFDESTPPAIIAALSNSYCRFCRKFTNHVSNNCPTRRAPENGVRDSRMDKMEDSIHEMMTILKSMKNKENSPKSSASTTDKNQTPGSSEKA